MSKTSPSHQISKESAQMDQNHQNTAADDLPTLPDETIVEIMDLYLQKHLPYAGYLPITACRLRYQKLAYPFTASPLLTKIFKERFFKHQAFAATFVDYASPIHLDHPYAFDMLGQRPMNANAMYANINDLRLDISIENTQERPWIPHSRVWQAIMDFFHILPVVCKILKKLNVNVTMFPFYVDRRIVGIWGSTEERVKSRLGEVIGVLHKFRRAELTAVVGGRYNVQMGGEVWSSTAGMTDEEIMLAFYAALKPGAGQTFTLETSESMA